MILKQDALTVCPHDVRIDGHCVRVEVERLPAQGHDLGAAASGAGQKVMTAAWSNSWSRVFA